MGEGGETNSGFPNHNQKSNSPSRPKANEVSGGQCLPGVKPFIGKGGVGIGMTGAGCIRIQVQQA